MITEKNPVGWSPSQWIVSAIYLFLVMATLILYLQWIIISQSPALVFVLNLINICLSHNTCNDTIQKASLRIGTINHNLTNWFMFLFLLLHYQSFFVLESNTNISKINSKQQHRYVKVWKFKLKMTKRKYFEVSQVLGLMMVLFQSPLIPWKAGIPNITELSQVFNLMTIQFEALRRTRSNRIKKLHKSFPLLFGYILFQ